MGNDRMKLIALVAAVAVSGCRNVANNARTAEAQFEAVHVGDTALAVQKAVGEDAWQNAYMVQQVSMPLSTGAVEWTTLEYKLKDGSRLYVTWDGRKVVNKQRLF